MCNVLHLGTDLKVPVSKWSEKNPKFCVQEEREPLVKRHFSKPHVYYLCSYEGCGCGFEFNDIEELKDAEHWAVHWKKLKADMKKAINWSPRDEFREYKRKKKCCDDMVKLVRKLLKKTDELEIYAVLQDPDQHKKPTVIKTITPDDIMPDGCFDLFPENNKQRILYKVKKSK